MKDPESSPKGKFSEIAHNYSQLSSLQQSAGQVLIKKLKIREDEDILDLGCGLGQLTAEIRKITQGSIFGVDPAASMINKARQTYEFHVKFNSPSSLQKNFRFHVRWM